MTTTGRPGHRPVIEVLYVQDCPHYPATLALVERMRAELRIDAELRPGLILDQAAAEQARFPGSPTVRVDGRDVEPGSEPATEYIVGCRLYRLEHRFAGQPEERGIREALLLAAGRSRADTAHAGDGGWRSPGRRTILQRGLAASQTLRVVSGGGGWTPRARCG